MIKVLHTADIHLDSPFSLLDIEKANKRREELRTTFHNSVTYAIDNQIDLFIIAGDLFDMEYVTAKTMDFVVEEMKRASKTRFIITPGNHDYYHDKSVYEDYSIPSNCYIFKSNDVERLTFNDIETDVYGFAYTSEEYRNNPFANRYQLNKNHLNIFVCHGDLDNPNSKYCPINKQDMERAGYDYVALGHIHKATTIDRIGNTYYAYSGCLEGRSFDECGSKGAIVCEFNKRLNAYKEVSYEGKFDYRRFAKRKYESIDVDITSLSKRDEIIQVIKKKMNEIRYDEFTLCRITLKGITDTNFDSSRLNITNTDLGVYYVEFKDKTIPLLDKDSFDVDITIRGVFYRELKPLLESEDENTREKAREALKFGLEALSGYKAKDIGN